MVRIKCEVTYDGTDYCGFQSQPKVRTVQGVIEKALVTIHKGQSVPIYASGRTDASVHAIGQVFHFDTELDIPPERWPRVFESLLPPDVTITQAEAVSDDFHARYSAVKKEYRYRVLLKEKDVFRRHYSFRVPYNVNIVALKDASKHLIGTHDFTSFCSTKTTKENKVRTIYELDIIEEQDELIFRIVGSGFLHNMVRIIVGTLLEVGYERKKPDDILKIIEVKNRKAAGKTAPGHGLFLWKVSYED
ncbi:tRNA pseudouridine(38-40) synthase TruA [Bacillus sp. FJAT-45350]|uniref:tRNA pseudouridine(38-40) synthase TruA n=1 Tax=Bacillus sp. FJAT-45350 TaxID=2011014 RepID=UPI000BB6BEDD|nr:tRNA pseudouridine(38-40) synthase TruA [Bacillus sp. FJAT-45350]